MANFTTSQANACTITRMEKQVAGSDITWKIEFNDSDGNVYDIKFRNLGDDPNKSDIKTAIINQIVDKMLKVGKQPEEVDITITDVTDKGLGETLG